MVLNSEDMWKVSNFILAIIIGLVVVSMVGLVIIQINWLKSAIILNEQKFDDKIFNALVQVQEKHGDRLQNEFNYSIRTGDPHFEDLFESLLRAEFTGANINQDFEFGIYDQQNKLIFGDYETVDFDGCSSVPYLCSYNLAVNFPNRNLASLQELGKTLAPSVLFVFILLGSFAFVIISLNKQKKLSEIKNDFINNLTHELKTPLASISLSTSLLKKQSVSNKGLKYLDIISKESDRLEGQIDKVLQIGQIDSGNFNLEKSKINIYNIIRKVVSSFEPLVKERDGQINLNFESDNHYLLADEVHLTNIIYNLIDNAFKYSNQKPEITIGVRESDDGLVITIRDNGIGMEREEQQLVFDKFYRAQTGDVHNIKGFGLGLSYVKNIIEAHKGKIKLKSKPDWGSEFQLYLPTK